MGFGLWRHETCACPCPDTKSRSEPPDPLHPLLLVPGCAALRAAPVRSPRMQVLQVLHPRAGLGVCFVYLHSCPSENVRQSQGAQPFQLGLLFLSYLLCFCFYVSPEVGKPFSEDAIFHWQRTAASSAAPESAAGSSSDQEKHGQAQLFLSFWSSPWQPPASARQPRCPSWPGAAPGTAGRWARGRGEEGDLAAGLTENRENTLKAGQPKIRPGICALLCRQA